MLVRLEPPIPLDTPKGRGLAHFIRDYGIDHDDFWTVAITETGEWWTFRNSDVRAVANFTTGQRVPKETRGEPSEMCAHGRLVGPRHPCPKCERARGRRTR